MAITFGEVSIISLAANLLAVPLVFVVVTSGLLSVTVQSTAVFVPTAVEFLRSAAAWLAGALAATSSAALGFIIDVSTYLSSLEYATVSTYGVPSWSIGVYVLVLLLLSRKGGRLLQHAVLASLSGVAATVLCLQVMQADNGEALRLHFIDVGQGDATLLEMPGGGAVLIDAGDAGERFDAGRDVIVPYLRRMGIDTLHALVLTHPDSDHIGGAGAVLAAMYVQRAISACTWPRSGRAGELTADIVAEGAETSDVRAGDTVSLSHDVRLYVLSPPRAELGTASNDNSVVLLLQYGRTRILLTGDAEAEAEQHMLSRYEGFLEVDVLKVGHHGSTTSSTPDFLTAVTPKTAVISCGRGNRFGHPKQEILSRLRTCGAEILRTDIEGAIILESNGRTVRRLRW